MAGDTADGFFDVFLFDRQTGVTTKITPLASNGNSYYPSVSGDGNWVAYQSLASNIVAGDTADIIWDVFLFDRQTGVTTKITPTSSNDFSERPSVSGDGNWVAYDSLASNIVAGDTADSIRDVFLFNRQTGVTTKITPLASNGHSLYSSVSGDGDWVAYYSVASNIVAGDNNQASDVFLFDNPLVSNEGSSNPTTPTTRNGPIGSEVNAAASTSSTVGMQKTGAPIQPILLALALLALGIIMPKRKIV